MTANSLLHRRRSLACARARREPLAVTAQCVAGMFPDCDTQSWALKDENRRGKTWQRMVFEPNGGAYNQGIIVNAACKKPQYGVGRFRAVVRLFDAGPRQVRPSLRAAAVHR